MLSAVMTIGEYARAVDLAVSAVRFYADRGLLPPASIDPTTGYRHYTDEQVPRGRLLRDLRMMDIGLADTASVLDMPAAERDAAIRSHVQAMQQRLTDVRRVARSLGSALDVGPGVATALSSDDLGRAVRQVLPAAGCDQRSPHHMSVLVEVRDESVRVVATDSHRLAVRDLLPTIVGSRFSAVVAAAEIRQWSDALAAPSQAIIEVAIGVADGVLSVRGSGLELCCSVIPIDFPDYEPVLKASAGLATTVVADREELIALLEFFEGDGTIEVASAGSELVATRADTVRRVAVEITGSDARVAINPRFAADAVSQAVGPEVVIEIHDPLHPLTFRSADDGTYTSMLMPVRLD